MVVRNKNYCEILIEKNGGLKYYTLKKEKIWKIYLMEVKMYKLNTWALFIEAFSNLKIF